MAGSMKDIKLRIKSVESTMLRQETKMSSSTEISRASP